MTNEEPLPKKVSVLSKVNLDILFIMCPFKL